MNTTRRTKTIAQLIRAASASNASADVVARLWHIRALSATEQDRLLTALWEHGYTRVLAGNWPEGLSA